MEKRKDTRMNMAVIASDALLMDVRHFCFTGKGWQKLKFPRVQYQSKTNDDGQPVFIGLLFPQTPTPVETR